MAVNRAMAELDFAPGELAEELYEVAVLVEPQEGFLGVGGVDAEVEVTLSDEAVSLRGPDTSMEDETDSPAVDRLDDSSAGGEGASGSTHGGVLEEGLDWQPRAGSRRLREMLELIRDEMGIEAEITVEETADTLSATVEGEDVGLFIGRRGQTLDAIEYLASVILYPDPDTRKSVDIDASGYKRRRRAGIERLAASKAQEAARRRRAVELDPMTPAERKIVHIFLRDRTDVYTESTGNEPERRVVIRPS